ncbi:MAG: amidase domain-containing protein [Lachnospiraceae bacterium]|nr:amidase domain-containing protein [Lachnospiraceae bacterium]
MTAEESSAQVFAQTPEIESKKYNVRHVFTLKMKNGEWYLTQHEQADCLYLVLESEGVEEEEIPERYMEIVEEYTALISERALNRGEAKPEEVLLASTQETDEKTQKDVLAAEETKLTADHPYDRESALAYSYTYIYTRNPDSFADYSYVGGNCQNFVSQCLYAGGIPMDTTGSEVWKWYDVNLSNYATQRGRSSSWTGVDEFVYYAENNEGYGLVAQVDAPYYTGEAGDVLQFGTVGDWRHAVLITDMICDEDGSVIDYLVNSNTSNLENYPASLYGYPEVILTKIIGWNEE